MAEQKFVAEAERETVPLVVTKVKGKEVVDPRVKGDPRTLISGRAAEFFRSERAKLGRDPTPAETSEWLGRFKLQPEVSWGKKPLPAGLEPDFMPGGYGAPYPKQQVTPAPAKETERKTVTVIRKADGRRKTMSADQAAQLDGSKFEVLP